MTRCLLRLAAALLASSCAGAAGAARADPASLKKPGEYFLSVVGIDAGLPHPTVTVTLQTRDGYLWVGTLGGLARFDGVRFLTYRPSNTPAFATASVRCLFEDAAGDLWIGTESGLLRLREERFELIGLRDTTITAIGQDRTGRIWVGTREQGLNAWHEGHWQRFEAEPLQPGLSVRSIFCDSDGRLWIGFQQLAGLFRHENGRFWREHDHPRLRVTEISTICEQPRGTLWLGGHNRGSVFRVRGDEVAEFDSQHGLMGTQVKDLRPSADGGLWVLASGVQKVVNLERFELASVVPEVEAEVMALREDREGSVWLGTKNDGLIQARPLPYRMISTKDGLAAPAVKSVTEDREGALWLAAQRGGIARVGRDGRVSVGAQVEGMSERETSLTLAARDGTVWFVSHHLHRWRDGIVTPFPSIHPVHGLYEDRQGAVWIGAGQGVLRYHEGRFTPVELPAGRAIQYACAFAETADGTMYLGSWNLGLSRVPAGRTTAEDFSRGLPIKTIRSLLVDREDRLWVGMKSGGLAVRHEDRWLNPHVLTEAVGGHVFALVEDDHGQIWLGTSLGVMWSHKEELLALARGQRDLPSLRVAGVNSGFHLAPAWPGGQPNVWKTRAGQLLFATVRGVMVVDPQHIAINDVPPLVRIERIEFDQSPLAPVAGLVAPAGTKGIALQYTAASFVQPGRVLFKYRLDGYDEDWIDAGTQRAVTYRNVPAGRYAFRVKACNNDGVWNEEGATLAFAVEPFFWETWWFRGGSVLAFALGIAAAVRYVSFRRLRLRLRVLEQQAALHKERARIARDIHDDVGNRLTEVSLLTSLAMREESASPKTGAYVQQISSSVRQVTDSLDEIVWAVSPRNDTLPSVIHYIGEFAVEFLQTAGIACKVDVPAQIPNRPVPAEIRHNLFLAVKEALNNAVRHACATEIFLRVTLADDALKMTVRDNGTGFAAPRESAGADGLRNMSQRMEEIGGRFELDSRPGVGTEVSFTYPWSQRQPAT